jgi:methylated-DNA-[protein]-cysteine S-methyltransferase
MMRQGFAVFATAVGTCGIAWGERGIIGVQLPEGSAAGAKARLRRRFPQAHETGPPPHVQRVIDGIAALLGGKPSDLTAVALDLDRVPEFHRRVYEIARTLGPGTTLTYGEIAARLGDPTLARDVGQALGRNPFPIIVPCHRVLAAGGKLGGFSAHGGASTKRRLLAIEGALPDRERTLFDLPLAPDHRA